MIRCTKGRATAGLVATLSLLTACVDNPTDPTDRYQGPLHPCEVVVDGSHEPYDEAEASGERVDPFAAQPAELWRPGPYPVWNTSPSTDCAADPTIDTIGIERIRHKDGELEEVEHTDVAMYVTYPARSVPTRTGDGRVADGKFPIILFAHANNDRTCNIYRGYYSLHDHWASWGYVVVAIDGTKLNCKAGTSQNLELRSAGQLAAIETLRELNEDENSRFYGRLDLERIIFAGHSRGGGASLLSAKEYPEALGVMDLQGVDLTAFGFGKGKTPEHIPVIGITAGNDVDLNYPHVEPTEDQVGGEYTWLNINGAIHAYTADGAPIEPDDEPGITREQQHDVTEYYTTAFLGRLTGLPRDRSGEFEPMEDAGEAILFSHQGAEIVDEKLSREGVYVRWRTGEATWIDDFESPMRDGDEPETNLLGGQNVSEGLERSVELATYKPDTSPTSGAYSKSYSRLLEAGTSAGTFTTFLSDDGSPLTVSKDWSLDARLKGPDEGPVANVTVKLETTDGTIDIDAADHLGPEDLSNRFSQLHVPLSEYADGDLEVLSVQFVVRDGSVFLDDLRFVH